MARSFHLELLRACGETRGAAGHTWVPSSEGAAGGQVEEGAHLGAAGGQQEEGSAQQDSGAAEPHGPRAGEEMAETWWHNEPFLCPQFVPDPQHPPCPPLMPTRAGRDLPVHGCLLPHLPCTLPGPVAARPTRPWWHWVDPGPGVAHPTRPSGPGWMQVLLLRVMAHCHALMGSPGQAGRCPADPQSRERGCAPDTAPQKLQQLLRGWGVPDVVEKVELLPLSWAGAALCLLCCLIPAVGSRRSWLNCDPSLCSPPCLASWDPPLSHGCLHLSCNRSDTGDLGTFSAPTTSQYIAFPLEI